MTTEFSITTQASNPVGITSGPDGALWFTEFSSNKVGRISISGTVTELAAPQSCYGGPQGITGGPDGALWLTQNQGNDIGRLTTTGVGNVYTIHTTFGGPCGQPLGPFYGPKADIVRGADDALWFIEGGGNIIGRITTTGTVGEFPLPSSDSHVMGLAVGPDGALWFTEVIAGYLTPPGGAVRKVGRLSTGGVVTEFSLPTQTGTFTIWPAGGITPGPDGALWFAEGDANKIGRVSTAGAVTEYAIPTANALPSGITAGADGALWFTESQGNQIGRITTSGLVSEYPVPTANSAPLGITAGPDGAIWFTEVMGNKIGRISLATGSDIGGKGLSIRSDSSGVELNWRGGSVQTGYAVLRLAQGALVQLPQTLPASATSFTDSTAPPGLDCYALLPLGTSPQARSDALCAVVGFHGGNAPTNFTLTLSQSNTPQFTWSPPAGGGQASFGLLQFGGPLVTFGPTTTSGAMPDVPNQVLTCYALGAFNTATPDLTSLTGYTDQECAYAGFSTLGP